MFWGSESIKTQRLSTFFSEGVFQWNPQVHIKVCTFQLRLNANPYIDNVNRWIVIINRWVVGMNSLASLWFYRMIETGLVSLTVCKYVLYVFSIVPNAVVPISIVMYTSWQLRGWPQVPKNTRFIPDHNNFVLERLK